MKIFTVHIRRHGLNPDRDLTVVKEGFNWLAFLFSGLWALSNRMWIVAAAMVAVSATIEVLLGVYGVSNLTSWIVHIGYATVIGLIANDLRRQALRRAGFAFVGLGAGNTPDEALSGFFATADPQVVQP